MSLLRMFFTNVYILASSGQWTLLAEYFALTRLVARTPEAIITAGKPADKEV